MATKVRAGIVGAGPVGGLGEGRSDSHAKGYTRIEECDLVAIADVDTKRLHQFGEQWGIDPENRYLTAEQMYAEANLDVISVTTPPIYHHNPVIEAADAGVKVILVEKPLAMSVEWGRKMVEACDRAGSRLITGHTRRFLPPFKKIKKMIADGLIGDVRTIETSGPRPLLANATHAVDYAFNWTDAEPKLVAGFLSDEPSPGPDASLFSKSMTLEAPGPQLADPGGAAMVVCEGGVVIFVNSVATRKESESATMIAGTQGRIHFVETRGLWEYGPMVETPGENYGATHAWEPIPDMPADQDLSHYFSGSTQETVSCFVEDRESVGSGLDGLKTLEVLTAIHISHKTGAMVPLPLAEGLDQYEIRSTQQ